MSPSRLLRALVRPRETFDGWTPSLGLVVGVVVLLCVLNAASVAVAGDAVTAQVTGTVTVDNPDHPPEWVCGDSELDASNFGDCNASETVQQPIRPAAATAVGGMTVVAALTPLAWVLLFGGLFVALAGSLGEGDGAALEAFGDGVGVAAVAAIPGVVRYGLRPIAVERSLGDWSYPTSLDGVGPAAVDALSPEGALWFAALALSGLWTAAIVLGAGRAVFDRGPLAAGVVAVGALFTTAGSALLPNAGATGVPAGLGLGLVLVLVGVLALLGTETYISISKSFELIGFSESGEVTPEPWYVALHRLGALLGVAVGFLFLDGLAYV